MNYRREIDGLRALAVLPVIFFHAGFEGFGGGFVGVDVFFVISGYLITSLIIEESEGGKFSIARFYERRARRILPALFLVMAFCIPLAWLTLLPGEMKNFSQSLVAVALFTSNIFFWRDSGYFSAASELKPLLHTWSLAVEEQFYVLFPLLFLFISKIGKKWFLSFFAIASVLSFAIAHWAAVGGREGAFYLLPTRGWELAIGVFIAFYFPQKDPISFQPRVNELAGSLGVILIFSAVFLFDKNLPFPSAYTLIPTIGAMLVIIFATPETAVGRALGCQLLVGIGLISYSAYLWHQPLFAFARQMGLMKTGLLMPLLVFVVVLAYLTWRFVEQPFRRRDVIGKKSVLMFSVVGAIAFVIFGLFGHYAEGFDSRYPIEDRPLAGIRYPEMGRYVDKRFIDLQLKNFEGDDRRKKVILIGDSYAKDLVNAVYESDLKKYFQISTFYISAVCGNLYLKEDFTDKLERHDLRGCRSHGWYEGDRLRGLIAESDYVWLASDWRPWNVELLPQSVRNLEKDFNAKVLVFGRKNFGTINIKSLLEVSPSERMLLRNDFDAGHVTINEFMRQSLGGISFVDVSRVICGPVDSCPVFVSQRELISYDGSHLTPSGAKYFGEKLFAHPLLRP